MITLYLREDTATITIALLFDYSFTLCTEAELRQIFSKFGKINSVKIMWPRADEDASRRRHNGFVSYCNREDADDARVNLSSMYRLVANVTVIVH